jgi:uncharacterized protein YcbK (DUF882 family)
MIEKLCTRRRFLQVGLTSLVGLAARPALAAMPRFKGTRALSFHNLHTDEKAHVTYWKDGAYDRTGQARINSILRDHYSGDEYPIHPKLIDLLFDLQNKLHNDDTIEIISGYRSPKTNLRLASARDGIAKHSYHTKGMAVDIRMAGSSLPKIHKAAMTMRRGGVGYYPDSQFVHVDVGPIRKW